MHITYFINQYPKVSHSFIRHEILALERQGLTVQRIALRGLNDALENGWLVPTGSLLDLTKALEEMLSASPQHLMKMGEAAYHRVKQRHDSDTEATKLASLFLESAQ